MCPILHLSVGQLCLVLTHCEKAHLDHEKSSQVVQLAHVYNIMSVNGSVPHTKSSPLPFNTCSLLPFFLHFLQVPMVTL